MFFGRQGGVGLFPCLSRGCERRDDEMNESKKSPKNNDDQICDNDDPDLEVVEESACRVVEV